MPEVYIPVIGQFFVEVAKYYLYLSPQVVKWSSFEEETNSDRLHKYLVGLVECACYELEDADWDENNHSVSFELDVIDHWVVVSTGNQAS